MLEDNIFAAIADGTLLDTVASFFLRRAIPSSITARNAHGHNYLEAALWIRIRTAKGVAASQMRMRGIPPEEHEWHLSGPERQEQRLHEASEEIVRYLLTEHPALLNQQNSAGLTPLMRLFTYQSGAGNYENDVEFKMAMLLLKHQVKGELQNTSGDTALHYATKKGVTGAVTKLCRIAPNIVNVQTVQGLTALHLATQHNTTAAATCKDMITTLVKAGADVNLAEKTGQLPLHHFVLVNMQNAEQGIKPFGSQTKPLGFYDLLCSSFLATVKKLCDASYSALARTDDVGQTALHLAYGRLTPESSPAARAYFLTLCALYCQQGHASVVMSIAEQSNGRLFIYLFAHPIDHNPKRTFKVAEDDPAHHLDVIMEALARLNNDKLTSLLSHSKDDAGRTLIHHIAQKQVMEFLRQYDGGESLDLNTVDNNGNTPLHVLLSKDIEDIKAPATQEYFAYLYEQGTKVNLPNQMGTTLLHLAVSHGVLSYTETLLKYGADLSIQDQAGRTPIHVDIRARQRSDTIDIGGKQQYRIKPAPQRLHSYLALLLRHASDKTICLQDKDGRTALHEAIMASDVDAVTYLLIRCPQLLNIEDNKGRTPLKLAELQRDKLSVRSYYRHTCEGISDHNARELMDELRSDSNEILTYLTTMTSASLAETSPQSVDVDAANAQIKAYAHDRDMVFLERLSRHEPNMPRAPETTYSRPNRPSRPSQDQYDHYDRQLEQYHADKAAFEQTKTELFADLRKLVQMDNLNTGDVQAPSRAVAGPMPLSAVPSSSSSAPPPVPQDSVIGSLDVTFMPPPSSSFSQTSCSTDPIARLM